MEKLRSLNNPNSLRNKFRKKRLKFLIKFIDTVLEKERKSELNICDLGGNYLFWSIFPFHNYPETTFNISLVNLESSKLFDRNDNFSNVNFYTEIGDSCNLINISDNHYDIVHSNSVIEHVGDWLRVKSMRDEVLRVGKYYFLQTPNFGFPVEPHHMLPFIHFLPRPVQTRLLMGIKKIDFDTATQKFDDNRLLSKKELKFLLPHGRFIKEKLMLLDKSIIVHSDFSNKGS